jgi:hypothetical protein
MFLLRTIILMLFINFSTYPQVIESSNVVGVWQLGSKELNSGWFDNYQFFSNGKFRFNINQNDLTKRIICIGGIYKIKDSILTLETTYSKEIKGGHLVRSEIAGGSGWELKGGTVTLITYKSKVISRLTIEKYANDENIECLFIDKNKYYKLEDDPVNYE